jgi:hypothetical protein
MIIKRFISINPSRLEIIRPRCLAEQGFKGKVVEGVYLHTLITKRGIIEPYNIHLDLIFKTGRNKHTILPLVGNLRTIMAGISPGSRLRIFYKGKKKIRGTRKYYHDFKLLVNR